MTEDEGGRPSSPPLASEAHTRFVILAAPRTGSNLLCTLLDSHPQILCHHELLNPDGIFYALGLRGSGFDLGSIEERDRAPLDFVDRVLDRSLGHACVGWKMTRDQAEGVLAGVVGRETLLKIVLRRANRVRTLVSERIAEQTGNWEMYRESEVSPEPLAVPIGRADLERHDELNARFYESIVSGLAAGGQRYLEVEYETLLTPESQQAVLGFLGVDAVDTELEPRSVRQNPWPLRRLIANYEELEAELKGSSFYDELVAAAGSGTG